MHLPHFIEVMGSKDKFHQGKDVNKALQKYYFYQVDPECMNRLELLLPPALVFGLFCGVMFLLARWLPVGDFDFLGRSVLMWVLLAFGGIVGVAAIYRFLKAGTSLNPHHPERSKVLVVGGVFNYSRNPMYLALLLALLAWGLYLENAFNTLVAALFVAYMNRFQIRPEERILTSKYGAAYRQYCSMVRRWF